MNKKIKTSLTLLSILFLTACGPIEETKPSPPDDADISKSSKATYSKYVRTEEDKLKNKEFKVLNSDVVVIPASSTEKVYDLAGNYSIFSVRTGGSLQSSNLFEQTNKNITIFDQAKFVSGHSKSKLDSEVHNFNQSALKNISLTKRKAQPTPKSVFSINRQDNIAGNDYSIGDRKLFYLDISGEKTKMAVLTNQTRTIYTEHGYRTINIWISEESYADPAKNGQCEEYFCIDGSKTEKLMKLFLSNGLDNDIYDKETALIGTEWEDLGYTELIGEDKTINIFLDDLGDDNSISGGLIGYFYAKDLFHRFDPNTQVPIYKGSNEMHIFYIDSQMFGNNNEFFDNQIKLTLIHEFEHMIHFYQRDVLKLRSTPTVVSELAALSMEDTLASIFKLNGHTGLPYPVGSANEDDLSNFTVDEADYISYLRNPNNSFTSWVRGSSLSYSSASLLGGYLLRNSDPKTFFNGLLNSNFLDERIISDAFRQASGLDLSFNEIVNNLGVSLILSNLTQIQTPYRLNDGGWMNCGGFELPSVNAFLYGIDFFGKSTQATLQDSSNEYLFEGSGVSGLVSFPATNTIKTYILKR